MTKPILTRVQSEKKQKRVVSRKADLPSVTPKSRGSSRANPDTFSDAVSQA
jgi:hypothetical protein